MNVTFIGTHNFAKEILQGIISQDSFLQVVQVITQPDKPVGRKKVLTPPPVKILAEELDIPIEQPKTLKHFSLKEDTEMVIVAQYGKIIPPSILQTPKYGVINVHTSLLPKYRGASPIQSALIHGEHITGVTIMQMDEGLDTGPILLQKELSIRPTETTVELSERLSKLGITALLESLPKYIEGSLIPTKQDNNKATYCTQLTRDDGKVHWNTTAQNIFNQYRGMTPWPGIWTKLKEKRVKLLNIALSDKNLPLQPGEISAKNNLIVGTKQGNILVKEIQIEGKKQMNAEDFLTGYRQAVDKQFFV